jgi:hypothetical protein
MKESLLASPDLGFVQSKLLYLLLLRSGKYTFLPDLFDAIGEDNDMMIRLLSMFAGQRITFPTPDQIAIHTRDITIFHRLYNLAGRTLATAAEELSADYGMEGDEVKRRYRIMREIANEAGISFKRR